MSENRYFSKVILVSFLCGLCSKFESDSTNETARMSERNYFPKVTLVVFRCDLCLNFQGVSINETTRMSENNVLVCLPHDLVCFVPIGGPLQINDASRFFFRKYIWLTQGQPSLSQVFGCCDSWVREYGSLAPLIALRSYV